MGKKRKVRKNHKKTRSSTRSVPEYEAILEEANPGAGLFNGYMLEPIPVMVILLILGIVLLVFLILSIHEMTTFDIPSDLIEKNITVCSMYEENDYTMLVTDAEQYYVAACFVGSVQERDELTVMVEPHQNGYGMKLWYVADSSGIIYATQQQVYSNAMKRERKSFYIILGANMLYWLCTFTGFYVVSHAPEYPRLARLFVRKEYLLIPDSDDSD